MTTITIPYSSPQMALDEKNDDFQNRNFQKYRNIIIDELRCIPGMPDIINEIVSQLKSPETVYKLVLKPEGAHLYKDAAGNIQGVFYKDGHIVQHARFKTENIKPDFMKSVSVIGSQILLISIAMQLNRIGEGISKIRSDLHRDRVAEINSGVTLYNQAMTMQNSEMQSKLILNAIQTLNTGIEKTIKSLKIQIEEAPDTKIGFFDNWFSDKAKEALNQFKLAEESFQISLLGIKTLCECYVTINEFQTATNALKGYLSNLKLSGIEQAIQKARLVPCKKNQYPEEPWQSFLDNESLFNDIDMCDLYANNEFNCIEIELKPMELKEKING